MIPGGAATKQYAAVTKRLLREFSDRNIFTRADRLASKIGRNVPPEIREPFDEWTDEFIVASMYYRGLLRDTRQGLLNLFAVGLYSLFEQEFAFWVRTALERFAELEPQKIHFDKLADMTRALARLGLDATHLSSWAEVDQLRLIANTVKHWEGPSCRKLRKVRADLFEPSNNAVGHSEPRAAVSGPLGGGGLYLDPNELQRKVQAINNLWRDLEHEVRKLAFSLSC